MALSIRVVRCSTSYVVGERRREIEEGSSKIRKSGEMIAEKKIDRSGRDGRDVGKERKTYREGRKTMQEPKINRTQKDRRNSGRCSWQTREPKDKKETKEDEEEKRAEGRARQTTPVALL